MTSASATVIDQLNELLEAEIGSIIRFMGDGSPYLDRAAADLRSLLHEMVGKIDIRAAAIADLIDRLGGVVNGPTGTNPQDQYLSFLSFKFLLPKLVEAKRLLIERYQNALRAIGEEVDGEEVLRLIQAFRDEHISELTTLQQAEKRALTTK